MPEVSIPEDRLARVLSPEFHFRKGAGKGVNGDVDVCVMQAVDWLSGRDGKSDHPSCASRVIADYCIRLNDSPLFADHRDLLKPYAPRIVGTSDVCGAVDRKRGYMAADRAVRVFAPIVLRAAGKNEWADELAALPAITDVTSARNVRDAVRKIRYADAAAYAAYAAAAADAAAYAAADAYAAAADAAYAARAKALAATCGDELRKESLRLLDDLITA